MGVMNRMVFLAAAVLGIACGRQSDAASSGEVSRAWAPVQAGTIVGVSTDDIRQAIQRRLHGTRPAEVTAERWIHVQRLYNSYNGAALWMEAEGPNKPRTNALLRAIVNASDDALRVDSYPLSELVQSISVVRESKTPTAEQLADADVLLTTTYVTLAEDLLGGQTDPKQLSQSWHIDAGGRSERVDSAVSRTLRTAKLDEGLARMRPQYDDYAALQKSLTHFRDIVTNGGWHTVPSGKLLKRGDHDSAARLSALRARLAAEGFTADSSDSTGKRAPTVYDRALAGAVAEFQARHGINVDSMLGTRRSTRSTCPPSTGSRQIAANLERYRWLPRNLGERYIYVNVPAFQLTAYDKGSRCSRARSSSGRSTRTRRRRCSPTRWRPSSSVRTGTITPGIQAKEIEPKIAADPGYLAANDMEYYRDGGKTRIRQRPGPKNALGYVKFLFPNDFNIYLHDTPNHELFDKDVRAFSHGCIRVEKPAELAQWVLGWDAGRVEEAMHRGRTTTPCGCRRRSPCTSSTRRRT